MSREPRWRDPKWEPSPDWPPEDRLEVVSAFCNLIQHDVYADCYSQSGRPNFTSVHAVIWETPEVLEGARASCLRLLDAARSE